MLPLFNAKYFSDDEIWSIIDDITKEQEKIVKLLAKPEISTDPEKMPPLAKKLSELELLLTPVNELVDILNDIKELEEIIAAEDDEVEIIQLNILHQEYWEKATQKAHHVYHYLLKDGYLVGEKEDNTDLKILDFLDYAGAEYAWRLSINIGIDVVEARERLDRLWDKGLIERVQGTILAGYHRERDWVKHMNHTYYRISREGRLYLRELRRNEG